MGRDNVVPPHLRVRHTRTRKPRPHEPREHQAKERGGKRESVAARHYCPTTPSKRANTKAHTPPTQTPTRTRDPATHRANTPTSSPSLPPPAQTRSRPRHSAWAKQRERRGNRGREGRPARNEAHTTDAGTQTAHTQKRKPRCLRQVCRLRPQGRTARREGPLTIAHARARGLSVFVGVFADVCRRFWAGWFGCLGVFWGCLACFMVF